MIAGLDSVILEKNGETSGALGSYLLAIDELDADQPLVITNSDQIIDYILDASLIHLVRAQQRQELSPSTGSSRWSYVLMMVAKMYFKHLKKGNVPECDCWLLLF